MVALNVDDQIEDAIALSRRTILVGAAAALSAKLASMSAAEMALALAAESKFDYARRHIMNFDIGAVSLPTADAAVGLNLVRGSNGVVLHQAYFNVRGLYRCSYERGFEIIMPRGDVLQVKVEAKGSVLKDVVLCLNMTVCDVDDDGYWLTYLEQHTIPGGKPQLYRLSTDLPSRENPFGEIISYVNVAEAITDPQKLRPVFFRDVDLFLEG